MTYPENLNKVVWNDVKDYIIGIRDRNGGVTAKKFTTVINRNTNEIGWTPYYQEHINYLFGYNSPKVHEITKEHIAGMLSVVIGHETKVCYPSENILNLYPSLVERIFRDFKNYSHKEDDN